MHICTIDEQFPWHPLYIAFLLMGFCACDLQCGLTESKIPECYVEVPGENRGSHLLPMMREELRNRAKDK